MEPQSTPLAKFLTDLLEEYKAGVDSEGMEMSISIVEDNAKSSVPPPITPERKKSQCPNQSVSISPSGNHIAQGKTIRPNDSPTSFLQGLASPSKPQESKSEYEQVFPIRSVDRRAIVLSRMDDLKQPWESPTSVINIMCSTNSAAAETASLNISPHLDVNLDASASRETKKEPLERSMHQIYQRTRSNV